MNATELIEKFTREGASLALIGPDHRQELEIVLGPRALLYYEVGADYEAHMIAYLCPVAEESEQRWREWQRWLGTDDNRARHTEAIAAEYANMMDGA